MKSALLAAALLTIATLPARAEDYSQIPTHIRTDIKAKCVAQYPDDYGMQHGCILVQSDSYMAVRGYAAEPEPMVEANGWVRGQITNAAQASAFETLCGKKWATWDGPAVVAEIKVMVMGGRASNDSTITPERFDELVKAEAAKLVATVKGRGRTAQGIYDVCDHDSSIGFDGKPIEIDVIAE